jgi:F-type H+-transporting ATPase subunit b
LEIARQDGLKEKEEIVRQAKEEAGQILIRAGQEARRERSKAWEDLWDEMVGIIITIATKAVGEEFNDEKHRAKIRSFIKQLDSKMIGELTNESH